MKFPKVRLSLVTLGGREVGMRKLKRFTRRGMAPGLGNILAGVSQTYGIQFATRRDCGRKLCSDRKMTYPTP